MGEGKLLYENSPGTLLRQTGSRLLADAVLQVYQRYESQCSDISNNTTSLEEGHNITRNGSNSIKNVNHDYSMEPKTSTKSKYANKCNLSLNGGFTSQTPLECAKTSKSSPPAMKTIVSLLKRNFIQMARNPWYLSFLLVLPAIQVLAAVMAIGSHPHDIKLGVVNYELSLNDSQLGKKLGLDFCQDQYYSCRYLKLIPEADVHLVRCLLTQAFIITCYAFTSTYAIIKR